VSAEVLHALGSAAAAEGAQLDVIAPDLRAAAVALIVEGDRRQFADPRWRRELAAGQALERILLAACDAGLQASYLNQPIQVEALRPRVGELLTRGGTPQLLLRLGYPADEPDAAPRRPVDAVIEAEPGQHDEPVA